jgi:transcriptional regulator with XRE-family HTH domain
MLVRKTLREWRVTRLLSTRALAQATDISNKTLIDIEHGRRRPHYGTISKVSQALDVEPGEVTEFAAALSELRQTRGRNKDTE